MGCIKFSGALSGLFDLNIGQSIPSGEEIYFLRLLHHCIGFLAFDENIHVTV